MLEEGGVDQGLVERARRGDREAYEALARSAAPKLYGIAYRIVRDAGQADDAVQETLVAMWRELPRLRDAARFDAWTYRLVARFAVREARRGHGMTGTVRPLAAEDVAGNDAVAAVADRDQLDRAFARLRPEPRAVVVLHYYVGLPPAEVSDVLRIPIGTVHSRLHYAMRALRAAIEADDRISVGGAAL